MSRGTAVAALLVLGPGAVLSGGTGRASGDPVPIVFSGEATASGMRVTIQVQDAPLTSTPFDVSAPTAYAQLDTIGGSNAYAAYPFPGTLFQSGPGIAVGLLHQSGVPVPSPPGLPNYVASDGTTPSAESGSGPYHLKATGSPTKADALATGGIRSDGSGNAGLATATATVESLGGTGGAVATAVSTGEALVIGPLTIGQVRSAVTVALKPDGTATPTMELAVSGVRIAGVPVSVTQDGLAAGGATVPLTNDPALSAALAEAGLSVELVAARQFDKGAVAPAVRITTPVPTPGLGDGTGSMVLVLGGVSASFSSFVPPLPGVVPPPVAEPAGSAGTGAARPDTPAAGPPASFSSFVPPLPGVVPPPVAEPAGSAGTGAARRAKPAAGPPATGSTTAARPRAPGLTAMPAPAGRSDSSPAPGGGPVPAAGPADVALRPGAPAVGAPVVSARELGEQFDILHLYLAAVVLGLVALGMTTLLRHLGVRSA